MIEFIVFLLILPFNVICALFVNPKKEYKKNSKFYRKLLYLNTWLIIRFLRIKVDVKGMEKIPQNTRFLLVGNHRSNFDPIITWNVFKQYDLAFISKESNFKIPIFGRFIRKCCFMAIDRENPKNALKTVINASELLKNNEVSVAVYPEGTRNKKNKELLPFHNGVFKISQKAKVPIVIVAIDGTELIHKNFPLKKSLIKMEVLNVIYPREVEIMQTKQIGEQVKTALLQSDLVY